MKICIWTVIPNHYQKSFFAALRAAGVDLQVCYYEKVHPERLSMGWSDFDQLSAGEQYVPRTLKSLHGVPEWRERIHIVPGYGSAFVRTLALELSREKVEWIHWSEPSHPGIRWWGSLPRKRWYARLVNRFALGAFGIGESALADFSRWGMRVERMAILPYSASPGDRNVAPDAQCARFRDGRLNYVFVGSLCRRKGVDLLLAAFAQIIRIKQNAVLTLAGNDHSRGAYFRKAAAFGIQDWVCFRGPMKPGDVSSVLRCADVLVLPSRFDGWGVVLNEGASMGLALIGSDRAGGSYHLIEPGVNGFRVRAGSVSSLANAMQVYTVEQSLASEHGARSLEIFGRYSPERNAARFIHAIETWQVMAR